MKHLELKPFLIENFDSSWMDQLGDFLYSDTFFKLGSQLNEEYSKHTIYPTKQDIFKAFRDTPFYKMKGVLLSNGFHLMDIPKEWKDQGIMVLDISLTSREGEIDSHRQLWRAFICIVIQLIVYNKDDIIWMLWGDQAKEYKMLMTNKSHGFVYAPSEIKSQEYFDQFNNELCVREKKEIVW